MQDNFTNIDKKFTDRAWKEMSKMLNDEMPVQSPPRKGWRRYLLLLLLLGVGIGVAFAWRATFGVDEQEPKPTITERPIAQANKKEIPKNVITHDNIDQKNIVKDKAELNDKSPIKKLKPLYDLKSSTQNSIISLDKNLSANFSKTSNAAKQILQEVRPVGKTNKTEELISQQADLEVPNSISSLALNEFAININSELNLPELPQSKKSRKRIFSPEVIAIKGNGIFHPIKTIDGIGGAMVAQYNLNNPKLAFETGIGYEYLVSNPAAQNKSLLNFSADAYEDVLSNIEQNGAGSFGVINKPAFNFSVPVDVENSYTVSADELGDSTRSFSLLQLPFDLHYLKIPIDIIYKISPRWRVRGGVNIAFLLASPITTSGGVLNFGNNRLDESSVEKQYADTTYPGNINQTTPIRKLDLAASVGLGYKISKGLEAGFQYNHGLIDHFNLNNLNSHNRYFQLSLAYNFNLNN